MLPILKITRGRFGACTVAGRRESRFCYATPTIWTSRRSGTSMRNTEQLRSLKNGRICKRGFAKADCFFAKFFPSRWVGGNVPIPPFTRRLPFLHLPAMPNRFIARMTDGAPHAPPRGAGRPRQASIIATMSRCHAYMARPRRQKSDRLLACPQLISRTSSSNPYAISRKQEFSWFLEALYRRLPCIATTTSGTISRTNCKSHS
jgi:hypothetical protein